jgi:hypothetical protein
MISAKIIPLAVTFLLSLFFSIVLPYNFQVLFFRVLGLANQRGELFALPIGVEGLWCLGCIVLAFPFLLSYAVLILVTNATDFSDLGPAFDITLHNVSVMRLTLGSLGVILLVIAHQVFFWWLLMYLLFCLPKTLGRMFRREPKPLPITN